MDGILEANTCVTVPFSNLTSKVCQSQLRKPTESLESLPGKRMECRLEYWHYHCKL